MKQAILCHGFTEPYYDFCGCISSHMNCLEIRSQKGGGGRWIYTMHFENVIGKVNVNLFSRLENTLGLSFIFSYVSRTPRFLSVCLKDCVCRCIFDGQCVWSLGQVGRLAPLHSVKAELP